MKIYIILVTILTIGFIAFLLSKNIKDIRIFNFSVFSILLSLYLLGIVIIKYIAPLASHTIKAEGNIWIENVISQEMDQENLEHDFTSIEILDYFLTKDQQFYLAKYTVNGREEARLFGFSSNLMGNLKPSFNFSQSSTISKEDGIQKLRSRKIQDGFQAYNINYGYSKGERKDISLGKFKIESVASNGYYMTIERSRTSLGFIFLLPIIMNSLMLLLSRNFKKEEKHLKFLRIRY